MLDTASLMVVASRGVQNAKDPTVWVAPARKASIPGLALSKRPLKRNGREGKKTN
jgi:hypothetical protein